MVYMEWDAWRGGNGGGGGIMLTGWNRTETRSVDTGDGGTAQAVSGSRDGCE